MVGQFDDVRAMAEKAYEATSQTNNWMHYGLTLAALTSLAVATGAFEAAESYAQEAIKSVTRYRFAFSGILALPALACAHALRGAHQKAVSAIEMLVEPGNVFEQPAPFYSTMAQVYRQLIQFYATGAAPPSETVEALLDSPWLTHCDSASLPLLCALIELQAGEPGAARAMQLYHKLVTVAEQDVYFSRGWMFFLPRLLGLASARHQWWDKAEAHFRTAIAFTTDIGARPELGRTYLDYARMLLARDGVKLGAFGKKLSAVINEAIDQYIELHQWQLRHIEQGVEEARRGVFTSDEEGETFFNQYGQPSG